MQSRRQRTQAYSEFAPQKRKKTHRTSRLIFSLILSFFLICSAVTLIYILFSLSKIKTLNSRTFSTLTPSEYAKQESEFGDTDHKALDDLKERINLANQQNKNKNEITGVKNVLLIGVDSRKPGEVTRSDSMILLTINSNTKKVYMTSFLRDLYVQIPNNGYNRLNSATVFGGPDLLLQTLKENYGVSVQDFIMVDFFAFAEVIDAVDGIEIDITDDEAREINRSVSLIENDSVDWHSSPELQGGGLQVLDGPQSLAYCRIRRLDSDFGRTERQRKALQALLNKVKQSDIATSNKILQSVLPHVETNISNASLLSFVIDSVNYLKWPVLSQQIPLTGKYDSIMVNGMSVLSDNFEASKEQLEKTVLKEY